MLVKKDEYLESIVSVILENLDLFEEAVDESEFDRSPGPPLQSFAASVTLAGDQLEVTPMKRQGGGHVGTGEYWHLKRSDAIRLPRMLLKALGERPEDIKRFLKRQATGRRALGRPTTG